MSVKKRKAGAVLRNTAKNRRERSYIEREREWLKQSRASGSVIFRHPQDVAFFGEYQRSAA